MNRTVLTLLLLFAVASFSCFWGSHMTPLFDTDEPRYAQAAREMMERNDWVLPTFNGQPRYAKPVLFYWLLIVAYKLFGVNEFAARFWSGVAAIAIALTLCLALKQAFGWETGLTASLFWLTSLGTLVFAHAAITDMVLTAFMAGATVAFWLGVQTGNPAWFFFASMLSAFAVLTKGPVGVVLPVAIFSAASFLVYRPVFNSVSLRRSTLTAIGCVFLFLAIALPWYVAVNMRTNGEFLRQFLFVENVQRYAQSGKLPLWAHAVYFPLTAFVLGFPWSSLGVWALGKVRGLLGKQRDWLTLFRVWAILPVLVFTFSKTKNPQYVLLSVPALTALAAIWLAVSSPDERRSRISWGVAAVIASTLLFLLQPALNLNPAWRMRLAGHEPVVLGWSVFAMGSLALAMAVFALLPRRLFVPLSVAAMLGLHLIALSAFVPRLGYYRQEPLKHFAQMAATQMKRGDLLVVFQRDLSSVVFYSNLKVKRVDDSGQLLKLLGQKRRVDVLLHIKSLPSLSQISGWHLVERKGAFLWVSNRKVRCPMHSR